jgi:hypothetical protein
MFLNVLNNDRKISVGVKIEIFFRPADDVAVLIKVLQEQT